MLDKNILSINPLIFTIDNFIDEKVSNYVIEGYKANLSQSEVIDGEKANINKERTSTSVFITSSDSKISKIQDELSDILSIPSNHFEPPQLTRYTKHQKYMPHFDAFEVQKNPDSQRIKTCILYLTSPFGGETIFDNLKISITPEVGKLLVFDNCFDSTIHLNPGSMHSSRPVMEGEKYILTIWVRNKEYL